MTHRLGLLAFAGLVAASPARALTDQEAAQMVRDHAEIRRALAGETDPAKRRRQDAADTRRRAAEAAERAAPPPPADAATQARLDRHCRPKGAPTGRFKPLRVGMTETEVRRCTVFDTPAEETSERWKSHRLKQLTYRRPANNGWPEVLYFKDGVLTSALPEDLTR